MSRPEDDDDWAGRLETPYRLGKAPDYRALIREARRALGLDAAYDQSEGRIRDLVAERAEALAKVTELERERDEAVDAADRNWVTHQQVQASLAKVAALEAEVRQTEEDAEIVEARLAGELDKARSEIAVLRVEIWKRINE